MHGPNFSERRIHRPQLAWPVATFLTSLFVVLFDNRLFWSSFIAKLGLDQPIDWVLLGVFAITLLLLLNLVFTLFAFRWVLKPFMAIILLLSASVSYFADTYGVIVDQSMIHNILETDFAEASELVSWPLLRHLTLYAAIPIVLLLISKLYYSGWKREILIRSGVLLGSVALVSGLAFTNYKEITFFGRENRSLEMYINPTHAIHSLKKVIKTNYFSHTGEPIRPIADDVQRAEEHPPRVVILVLGETARAQSFSLNGYPRDTNPRLEREALVDFSHVESCGTSTAESLPCMFSHQEHSDYSRSRAMREENLLDLLSHAGVRVLWRDNDSGSKGVADRVEYQNLSHQHDTRFCAADNCYDEILLEGLEPLIASTSEDTLIVLHTKGSHGPSYYKRTPPEFKTFMPECAQDNVQDCEQQAVVNAYDNTIVYTDYILSRVIKILKARDIATAMLYISDHGESLGEKGLYLHGLPYALAPEEQTQVPMIFWASEKFFTEEQIDKAVLSDERNNTFSHDNLFHSILGIFDVKTAIYKPELDLFASTRRLKHGEDG